MSRIRFFLSWNKPKGARFVVHSDAGYQVGDAVPLYSTDPNARNSQIQPVGEAICVAQLEQDPKFTPQSYSDPRRRVPLPAVNTGKDQYEFEVRE